MNREDGSAKRSLNFRGVVLKHEAHHDPINQKWSFAIQDRRETQGRHGRITTEQTDG